MQRVLIAIAALATCLTVTATRSFAKEAEWVKLGTRTVEFKGDHDTIEMGKSEGKFMRLRFKVEDGDLIVEKIKITFANGEVVEPEAKHEFKEGSRSHDLELPEGVHGRTIRKVEFFYHSVRHGDKATIVLYGQEKN